MAKIRVFMEVYEEAIKDVSEQQDLADTIDQELNRLCGSGIGIQTWDYVDRPSRFLHKAHQGFGGPRDRMNRCSSCPRRKTCRETCYGETPCVFAQIFDQMIFREDLQTTRMDSLRTELTHAKTNVLVHRVFGDYVLTPIPNAFNGKTSWWISKKGFATAHYCFSTSDPAEAERQIADGLDGYMKLLDAKLK